jgi:hypothetical protein
VSILNKKLVKSQALDIIKESQAIGSKRITRVGADLINLCEAAAHDAIAGVIRKALAQHRAGKATLSAPTSAGIPPSKRRK